MDTFERNIIGIYSGQGVSWEFTEAGLAPYRQYGFEIKHISLKALMDEDALDPATTKLAAFFLMGSSRGQYYRDDMGQYGFAKIRNFAWNGGMVVGVCAGGYLLCRDVDYCNPTFQRQTADNIGLFKATAVGELSSLLRPNMPYDGWFRANATSVTVEGRAAELVYWGGAHLVPDADEKVNVLATYNGITGPEQKPAIAVAHKTYGKGDAVFCGVHPEVSAEILKTHPNSRFNDRDDGAHRLEMAHRVCDTTRQRLFDNIMKPLLAKRLQAA